MSEPTSKKSPTPNQKTKCPITREEFLAEAKPIQLTLPNGGGTLVLEPKVFSSGSFGWGVSEKANLSVGDKHLRTQCGMNLVVVGSKDAG